MTNAPERIWIEDEFGDGDDDQWTYGTWDVRNYRDYVVEYVRADLALPAVQPDAREAALREAAKVLADRAGYLEDAVKWGGSKQYLASLKGGAIELRHARNSILALINKPAHD